MEAKRKQRKGNNLDLKHCIWIDGVRYLFVKIMDRQSDTRTEWQRGRELENRG